MRQLQHGVIRCSRVLSTVILVLSVVQTDGFTIRSSLSHDR
jgi:hypothetical protein